MEWCWLGGNAGPGGGGIFNRGVLTLNNCDISYNVADFGAVFGVMVSLLE